MTIRFMGRQQRLIYQRLVQIAGSPLLVEEALSELNRGGRTPTLDAIVEYLLEHRTAWHRQRRRTAEQSQPAQATATV